MENRGSNFIKYLVVGILCTFVGCALMYGLIYFFPNTIVKTISKVEKEVTVHENGIADGVDAIKDAVVVIENIKLTRLAGNGSGFIYDKSGLIITNNHVVDGATELKVLLSSGERVDAKLIGTDSFADIAVIKIDESHVKSIAKLGNSEKTNIGDTVFAIGSPMSSKYSGTVTRGIISGKNRMVEVSLATNGASDYIINVMQTDAAINPGNSGGPLCNISGEVIGVNNMKIVESSVEGIGFSIPIEDAVKWANKIVNKEDIKRSYLGIQMTDLQSTSLYYLRKEGIDIDTSITTGVIVAETVENGPCEKAGIKKGDVIVKIGDYDVNNVAELRYYLYKYEPNTKVDIKFYRGTAIKNAKVTLGISE